MMLGTKRICRVRVAKDELEKMSKEDFHKSWLLQEQYVDYIEGKLNENTDQSELVTLRESEEKLKQHQLDTTRKENILVMRLTTKEQEMQEYVGQIQELKQAQIPTVAQLRAALLDPAVNLMFERMRQEIETVKARLQETQDELTAWKFTPDSNTGKRLMAKCRVLHQENEELGKTLSSGRFAKLEGDLALQKNFCEEMKKSQSELDEFVMELDEDVEGMQSTIYYLQQQLRECKDQIAKLQKDKDKLAGSALNSPINHCIIREDVRSHASPVGKANVTSPNVQPMKSPQTPPVDLNRTESLTNPKPNKGSNSGQPWSPPPTKEEVRTDNAQALTVKVEPPIVNEKPSSNHTSPQSKANDQLLVVDTTLDLTVATARGSLHMEEYDSETESQGTTEECNSKNTFVLKKNDPPPVTSHKKVTESTSKRTTENGGKGRKRTRGSRTPAADKGTPSELPPPVKRLRRRDVVVDKTAPGADQKRTTLEIDTDTEVQVAHTLAQWAVTNKERKDITSRDIVSESLGNGELKANKNNEVAN